MNGAFSINEAFSFGWNTFKKGWKFWLIAYAITIGAGSGLNMGSGLDTSFLKSSQTDEQMRQEATLDARSRISNVRTDKNVIVDTEGNVTVDVKNTERGIAAPAPMDVGFSITKIILGFILVVWGSITLIFAIISGLFMLAVSQTVMLGFFRLCIDAVRGNELRYATLLSLVNVRRGIRFFFATLFFTFLFIIGLLLLIVPGIWFCSKYGFYYYGIVDKDLGILDSFRYSSRLTSGSRMKIAGYNILALLMVIGGFVFFFVGGLLASLIISLSFAYIYEALRKRLEGNIAQNEVPLVAN